MSRLIPLGLLAVVSILIVPTQALGQIQASERAVVSQTVDGTTLTLEYSRPVARGRELFGALVPWGVVWTPGANWATTLEVDKDIRLNGVPVSAGKYSVWAIPNRDHFTISLNPNPTIFHFVKPDSTSEQIHISAVPTQASHVEMLTWSFPVVRGDGAVLNMQWGTTAVALEVVVQPSRPVVLAADVRDQFIGVYEMRFPPWTPWPAEGRLEIFATDGLLRGRLPFRLHSDDELEFSLIPAGGPRFNPGLLRGDQLFNVEMGINLEFVVEDGHATVLKFLTPWGDLMGEGPLVR